MSCDETATLEVIANIHPWASRGGQKLVAALDSFAIDVSDSVCLDLGASTGGFTDVLISRQAKRVYAVDVGSGQLASHLTENEVVVNLEQTDARNLSLTLIPDPIDIIVCDVSFISLKKVLPVPMRFARQGGKLICLLKPQFEGGPGKVDKRGVLRDASLRKSILESTSIWLDTCLGWHFEGSIDSPIKGGDGNIEFLLVCSKSNRFA
tara:strand:- start:2411 stop:3034 length:624 start_codon:yes stop_codon:yes gene_type:complete